MAREQHLVAAGDLDLSGKTVLVDCRFSLADAEAGRASWTEGHIPGAHYLHLESDLSGEVGAHGGRHPLPAAAAFATRLAALGIGLATPVVAYDDSRFAFASRLWWMMRSLGYTGVRVLDGGLSAWLAAGGELTSEVPVARPVEVPTVGEFSGALDIESVRSAQARGALLVDSREPGRYQGLEEPIDPVAGHIPGALNKPWQGVTDDQGLALGDAEQQQRWQDLPAEGPLVVYCGSGVTACVNLLSLAVAGRDDAELYAGSCSDWCSYL